MAASLVGRRAFHDEDGRARAGFARGERDALRGVAGADGPDAVRASRRAVSCATAFIAPRILNEPIGWKDFELQEDLRAAAADRVEPDERRARGDGVDAGGGGANGVDGNVARHAGDLGSYQVAGPGSACGSDWRQHCVRDLARSSLGIAEMTYVARSIGGNS